MEKAELIKQFQITIFEKQLLITTPTNDKEAYCAELNIPVELKIGWHDSIETADAALNYHECCGVLILFGITPPSFDELFNHLK